MSKSIARFDDFDSHQTPEEMEQDWIEWTDDLREEIEGVYQTMDENEHWDTEDIGDPGYRDEDRWFDNPSDYFDI